MIFYFSGTGNTRWAAKELAKATGEQLYFIPNELNGECLYNLNNEESIGFCFPIHGWQPPQIVRTFLQRATFTFSTRPYIYVLCTCGDTVGNALKMFDRELNAKGLHYADAKFSLVMPESYVCLPFMYTDSPEREQAKLEKAVEDIKSMIVLIGKKQPTAEEHLVKGATPRLYTNIIGSFFNRKMITDKPFRVSEKDCTGCGRCQRACPVGCVNLLENNGKKLPMWKHDGSCTCCLACYHNCPHHAINYGRWTRKRSQYVYHPAVE